MKDSKEAQEHRRNKVLAFFNKRWDEIETVIDYNYEWELPISAEALKIRRERKELEYSLRGIYNDPTLKDSSAGSVAKSMDDYGRKVILVWSPIGIFYSYIISKDPRGNTVATTRPDNILKIGLEMVGWGFPEQVIHLTEIVGSPFGISENDKRIYRNIGIWLPLTAKAIIDPSYQPRNIKRCRGDGSDW